MSEKVDVDIGLAVVSIGKGRAAIRKMIDRGDRVTITITGQLVCEWGRDDGTDQEFEMEVTSAKVRAGRIKPRARQS